MAKRRAKSKVKTVYRKAKASYKRSSKSNNPTSLIIPAAVYGAIRAPIAQALDPVLSKIPFGNMADELGLGIVSYFAAKKGKGMIKKIGTVGLVVESARVGELVISGGLMNTNKASAPSMSIYQM